jgi:hypothetical protein
MRCIVWVGCTLQEAQAARKTFGSDGRVEKTAQRGVPSFVLFDRNYYYDNQIDERWAGRVARTGDVRMHTVFYFKASMKEMTGEI